MGGGVSCGTFSGAALTEVIKQAIVYARPRKPGKNEFEEEPYDRVIVDVFAGASAGTMSLGIMLRGLVEPIPLTDTPFSTSAEERLKAQFNNAYDQLPDDKKKDLIYAQQLQDVQHVIWTQEINLDTLVPSKNPKPDEKGLLRSEAVYDIAKKYFKTTPTPGKKRILADRVLFGGSISNLTGINYDARRRLNIRPKEIKGDFDDAIVEALNSGLVSTSHRELRIFDIKFEGTFENDGLDEPKQWCRFDSRVQKSTPQEDGYHVDNIYSSQAWGQIVGTSVASGAFPFGFAPVPLTRRAHEFGNHWPEELRDQPDHIFTYVDGGTFLNEPIREAFRLASYLDSQEADPDTFDRRVIFVDPIVSPVEGEFKVPFWEDFSEGGKFLNLPNRYDIHAATPRSSVISAAGSILGAFWNQAQVKPADTVIDTRKSFYLRSFITKALSKIEPESISVEDLRKVYAACEDHATELWEHQKLPSTAKFERLLQLWIKTKKYSSQLTVEHIAPFKTWVKGTSQDKPEHYHAWYLLLVNILAEVNMKLLGKDNQAFLLPIAPLRRNQGKLTLAPLPGAALAGFAGFGSYAAGVFEVEFAKQAAIDMMRELWLIPQDVPDYKYWEVFADTDGCRELAQKVGNRTGDLPKDFVFFDDINQDEEWLDGMNRLLDRIVNILSVNSDHFGFQFLKLINGYRSIAWFLRRLDLGQKFEFRIKVKEKSRLELDGRGVLNDLKPIEIDGEHFLISFNGAEIIKIKNEEKLLWSGYHLREKDELQVLPIRKDQLLNPFDIAYANLELPSLSDFKKAKQMGNPVFTYDLTAQGKQGKNDPPLPASKWILKNMITPIEESLF